MRGKSKLGWVHVTAWTIHPKKGKVAVTAFAVCTTTASAVERKSQVLQSHRHGFELSVLSKSFSFNLSVIYMGFRELT